MDEQEIREQISKTMGWWAPGSSLSRDIGHGFDAYPEKTDKVMQLLAAQREADRAVMLGEIEQKMPLKKTGHAWAEAEAEVIDQCLAAVRGVLGGQE